MAAGLGLLGSAVSAAGTIAGGAAANQAAQAQAQALEFRAQQEEMAAAEARALGYRAGSDQRREGRLVDSRIQAVAAASGGGATDPTVLNIQGDVAREAEYRAMMGGYRGESKARGLEDQAAATRMGAQAAIAQGKATQQAYTLSGLGTIIGGVGSAYSKFSGAPATTTAAAPGDPLSLDPRKYGTSRLFGYG